MKRVEVNGLSYALPFANLLPPFTEARFAEFLEDVRAHGVLQAVIVATTPTWGRCVVEGMHRSLAADLLDIDVPVANLGHMTDSQARERCLALNLKRRHMTLEEQQAARRDRIVRVAALASQGKTEREIAAIEGVSNCQVHKDLELHRSILANGLAAPRRRRRRPPAQRALSNVTSLFGSIRAVMRDKARRAALEAVAAQHGIPLSGTSWPALEQIRAVLRDVANGGAQV